MNEIIRKRKSIRKFDMATLDKATLEKVKSFADSVKPLNPNIKYKIEFAEKTKGLFNIKAPHYLVFKSEIVDGSYENIGFIGQQIDIFLAESGLGSCWLGLAKDLDNKEDIGLSHVICIAFGMPSEPLYRDLVDFKRKPLNMISEGNDIRIEAARLAPSGMNRQNWFFVVENGEIHCFRKKSDLISGLLFDKLESIDIGIAICHIAMESDNFNFSKKNNAPTRKGFIYTGTII